MSLSQSLASGDMQDTESSPSHPNGCHQTGATSAALENSAAAPGVWLCQPASCPSSEWRALLAGRPERGVSSLVWRGSSLVHSSARHSSR